MPWLFILAVLLAFSSLLSTANGVGAQDSTPPPTDASVETPTPPTEMPPPPTDTPVPPPTDERRFSAQAALDESDTQDWGYSLLPSNRLATQVLVGLGLGNVNKPPDADESRIYVTALDGTTIFVDYDNDGQVDNSFAVSPLAEVPITAPNHNMTGAFLFTSDGMPCAIVWGQNESVPEALPAAVIYIPNTTLLNGNPLPDNSNRSPFPFDEGSFNTGELPALGKGFLTFPVIINDDTLPIINQANISSEDLPSVSDSVIMFTTTQARAPLHQIDQTLVDPPDGFALSDRVITFNLAITNTGRDTNAKFPLQDNFSAAQLTFQNAIPAANRVTPGQPGWNDLILTEEQTFINEFLLLVLVSSLAAIHFLGKDNT